MANAELNVILSGDGRQLLKTLGQAESELKGFQQELKNATNTADVDRLNKSIAQTKSQLDLIKNFKSPGLNNLSASSNKATESLVNLGRVAQDAPFGFIGITNNINPLLESFQRLKKETGSTKGALKSLVAGLGGAGGLGLAVSVVSSLLVVFGDRLFKTSKAVDAANEANKKYKEGIENIFQNAGKEASEVLSLIAVLKNETETRERKLAAIKELQKIQPDVFNNLKLEGNAVAGLDAAYENYINNLRTVIAVKIKQAKLEQLLTKQLEKQGATLTTSEKTIQQAAEAFKNLRAENIGGVGGDVTPFAIQLEKDRKKALAEGDKLTKDIEGLFKDITELSTGVEVKVDNKEAKKEVDKFFNDLMKRVKAYEKFINDQGLRIANFDIIPDEPRVETIKRAQTFLQNAINRRFSFDINPKLLIEAPQVIKGEKFFAGLKVESAKMFADLQEEVNKLTGRNKILIQAQVSIEREKARGAELATSVGVNLEGVNAPISLLTKAQKEAVNAANTINAVLTPAFENMFEAIKSGESPIKAFFQGLGQAVTQLIQKLIAAALQALVLSAIFPGLGGGKGGFGNIFKSLLGFRAEGGPVLAGKPYVVGEKGPELFVPQRGGQIVPNNEMNTGLSGITAGSLHITVDGRLRGRDIRLGSSRQAGFENRNI